MPEAPESPPREVVDLGDPAIVGIDAVGRQARLVLRAAPATVDRLLQWTGLALPSRINAARVTGDRAVLQLGPDEWLVLSGQDAGTVDHGRAATLAAQIAQSAGSAPHSVVDVSDRFVGLRLTGPAVEDVLAVGCPLPLTLAAFPVGRATRTLFGKAEIVLWRQADTTFRLEIGRSFAPYVGSLIAQAIRDEAAMRRPVVGTSGGARPQA